MGRTVRVGKALTFVADASPAGGKWVGGISLEVEDHEVMPERIDQVLALLEADARGGSKKLRDDHDAARALPAVDDCERAENVAKALEKDSAWKDRRKSATGPASDRADLP